MANAMTDERLEEIRDTLRAEDDFGPVMSAAEDLLVEVDRLKARAMTMDKALRIVDAIGQHPIAADDVQAIYNRMVEIETEEPKMRASEVVRLAQAEFVLRVVNDE